MSAEKQGGATFLSPAEPLQATMKIKNHTHCSPSAIEELFTSVFTDSDGKEEGEMVGHLAGELIAETNEQDLHGFVGLDEDRQLVAAIFFTRLTFPSNDITTFLLSPVAVHSDHQGKGLGQGLINHGLDALRSEGVRFAITYGDPDFYRKVGFHPVSPEVIEPPFELSQPEGWLGQSLHTDSSIHSLKGKCSCVPALYNSIYW